MQEVDVIVIGAGAAGVMCAIEAGRRGRRVVILEHTRKLGGKILISGGGRCNFTNRDAGASNYVSANPHFCVSALKRFPPRAFIERVEAHGIPYHEKTLGQLFCDRSAQDIVDMLSQDAHAAGVKTVFRQEIGSITKSGSRFLVSTQTDSYLAESCVIATGGLSLPKLGATDFGYKMAKQFGHGIVSTAPALDGFVFGADDSKRFHDLAGVAFDSKVTTGGKTFREQALFTHGGLSGPAALQASLHWESGAEVCVDFLPAASASDLETAISKARRAGGKQELRPWLAERLPRSLVDALAPAGLRIADLSNERLKGLLKAWKEFRFVPAHTVGYSKAEVTRGGVDTRDLSSKTMESLKVPGLYFIGEVVDVTGWLGGYNFQWAWASGWAAGQVV